MKKNRCYGCLQLKEIGPDDYVCTAKNLKISREDAEIEKECIDRVEKLQRVNSKAITFEIVEEHGTFDPGEEWSGQVNTVSWNGNPPRLDIRYWKSDRSRSRKLGALSDEAGGELYKILKKIYGGK